MEHKMAYLILAHKNDETFRTLIKMLDDERNDLYIHMDLKNSTYQANEIQSLVTKSKVFHCKRTSIAWGGYSMVNAELLLLDQAVKNGPYAHYHLLSGEDLPIKSRDYIYDFYRRHAGEEFVEFDAPAFNCPERVSYYYWFQEKAGRSENRYSLWQGRGIMLQQKLHLCRNSDVEFQKGAQWFSITDEFAKYILSQRKWIRKTFKDTKCCDEIFLQTVLLHSPFISNLFHKEFDNDYRSIMRLIDWNRGLPYVFQKDDFEELMASDRLFARKFQAEKDIKIINMIYDACS